MRNRQLQQVELRAKLVHLLVLERTLAHSDKRVHAYKYDGCCNTDENPRQTVNECLQCWRRSCIVETAVGKRFKCSKHPYAINTWADDLNSEEHNGCSRSCAHDFAQILACELHNRTCHDKRQNQTEDEEHKNEGEVSTPVTDLSRTPLVLKLSPLLENAEWHQKPKKRGESQIDRPSRLQHIDGCRTIQVWPAPAAEILCPNILVT
mmetsp:Transcript_7352/g.16081  ORF Transcript_7352/g.16081 Transcript_7352/m.16081 type:complete len:207 (+) Transcript_7352:643-1263(+)